MRSRTQAVYVISVAAELAGMHPQTLRSDERTESVPVVALTAQAMYGDRERFLGVGFDGYLSKPVNVSELLVAVEEHCNRA